MTKKYLFVLRMIVILLLPVFFYNCNTVKHPNVETADRLASENNFDEAVEYYTKALSENPDDIALKLRLKETKQRASISHMQKAKTLINKKFYKEAIEELQMAIAFYSGNHRAIELVGNVKMMKESQYLVDKGKKQIQLGDFQNAKISFQKSIQLDPDNSDAKAALEQFKKRKDDISKYQLDFRTKKPISLKFKKTPVLNVFEILSKLSGINFIFDKDITETKVTLFMTDVKPDRFLDVLLRTNSLRAKRIDSTTLLIYPDTPQKAKEYDELYVKTFYLSHLKAKNAVAILTKILKSKNIIANEKLNAVTVRGHKDKVDMAGRIISANDRTPSEVILNVEIMEVQRKKEKDLGLSISDTVTFGVSEESSGIDFDTDFGFASMASIHDISRITSKELYLSLPTATLKLLKKDGDTKILAKPQLRVSSSEKASILIGEKVPLRTNRRVQTDGSTTYDFQYQDVGVKLVAEPVINMFNQVTMKLAIEISALGSNVGTVTDPQFSIKTRTTNTVLTIQDGDSVIIAGLIEDDDRATIQKIPLLGDIPAMGDLFSSEDSEIINTDILMAITPVIIRSQDIPQDNLSGFWSGTEKQVSLDEPHEQKIIENAGLKDAPDDDYVMVLTEDVFLPSDKFYSIQIYSSKDEKESENKAEQIREIGYQAWVKPADIKDKGMFYRVFLGQYTSYQEAEQARLELLKKDGFRKDIHIVDRAYVYGK